MSVSVISLLIISVIYVSIYLQRERENCSRVIGSRDNGDPEVPPSAIYKLEPPSYLLTCRREN